MSLSKERFWPGLNVAAKQALIDSDFKIVWPRAFCFSCHEFRLADIEFCSAPEKTGWFPGWSGIPGEDGYRSSASLVVVNLLLRQRRHQTLQLRRILMLWRLMQLAVVTRAAATPFAYDCPSRMEKLKAVGHENNVRRAECSSGC